MDKYRIAVVGSGPAGLYAADQLVRQDAFDVEVDIIDRVPTPYGLVRYGVAPDHPRIKSVIRSLQRILEHPRVRLLGNINVGTDIEPELLNEYYAAVVYATGASLDRHLGVAGEDLPGSHSATRFVSWYSGHPDQDETFELDATSVAVIGAGNVALDVARILAKTPEELHHTDMPPHVLHGLEQSNIRDIHIVCRRGPEHAKFTTKELRELLDLADACVIVDPQHLAQIPDTDYDSASLANIEAFREMAEKPDTGGTRRIHFHFWQKPLEIVGSGSVEGIALERTELTTDGTVKGTGEVTTVPVQLVLRSVGYRSSPLSWLPFDDVRGVIPNRAGRVVDADGDVLERQYVSGWVKRGPSGIIGTNRLDSSETVKSLLADLETGVTLKYRSADDVDKALLQRNVAFTTFAGWQNIDDEEVLRGKIAGRDRTKISDWDTLRRFGTAARAVAVQGRTES